MLWTNNTVLNSYFLDIEKHSLQCRCTSVGLNVFNVLSCSITAERSVTENVGNKETKTSGGCFTTPPSGVMFNSSEVAVVDTKVT